MTVEKQWCIPKSRVSLIVALVVSGLILIHLIVIFVYLIVNTTFVEKMKRARNATISATKKFLERSKKFLVASVTFIKDSISSIIKTIKNFLKKNFGKPTRERFDFIQATLFILLASEIAVTIVWFERNPFILFQESTIDRLGFPKDLLNSHSMEKMFSEWAFWGQSLSVASFSIGILFFSNLLIQSIHYFYFKNNPHIYFSQSDSNTYLHNWRGYVFSVDIILGPFVYVRYEACCIS